MTKAFNNVSYNKLHLTFPNGNSISTIWGYCSYSDNYDMKTNDNDPIKKFNSFLSSDTVEIMVLECSDKLKKKIKKKFELDDASIIGHLTITDWLKIINLLAK